MCSLPYSLSEILPHIYQISASVADYYSCAFMYSNSFLFLKLTCKRHSVLPSTGTKDEYLTLKPECLPEPRVKNETNAVFPLHMMSPGRVLPQNEYFTGAVVSFPS